MDKQTIILILEEMGTLLELQGANPFKSRAFHNASRAIEAVTDDLRELVTEGRLQEIRGIGKGIALVVADLVTNGTSRDYENLRKVFPPGILELLKIPGLGPKRVKILFERKRISSIDDLEGAAKNGTLSDLEGFGPKTQENILAGIVSLRTQSGRVLYGDAEAPARALLGDLLKIAGVARGELAGSLRRKRETIGDIDIVVSAPTTARSRVMEAFASHPLAVSVIARGDTKTSVLLSGDLQCDLRVVGDDEYPFALNYFTGSKEHNVELRTRARALGLSLNEYGFSRLPGEHKRTPSRGLRCRTEAEIYQTLGLPLIPPELRESTGEFEAAERGELPGLIEEGDLRGTFHCHTTYSDGLHSLEQMAAAATARGWEYLGIADHSRSAAYAGGLTAARVRAQLQDIAAINKRGVGATLLSGTECDILPDGSLDWPDKLLAEFDYVVVSVHSSFKMTESAMTKRVVKALKQKHVTMLGHPTGRLLQAREGYPIDMMQVLRAAADYGKVIEINAHPMRLDLDWRLGRVAKELGVMLAINPDAHSIDGLGDVRYGVGIARKGWQETANVLNTRTLEEVRRYLAQR